MKSKYKPGDLNKVTDTVAALEIAMTVVLGRLAEDPTLQAGLISDLSVLAQDAREKLPPGMRDRVASLLKAWRDEIATKPPMH